MINSEKSYSHSGLNNRETDLNYLRLYITDYTFANMDELYNRNVYRLLRSRPKVKTTKLYAIVKTDKIIFDIDTFYIDNKYEISCDLIINNTKKTVKFNLLQMYYDQFGADFKDYRVFKLSLENRLLDLDYMKKNNLNAKDFYQQISAYKEENNRDNLVLNCPFYYILSKGATSEISINVYRILNYLNIDLVNDLEIIYIGKSMKSTMKRLREHNKWGEVQARDKQSSNTNSNYIVYVFNLDKADTSISHFDSNNVLIVNNNSEVDLKNIVSILEIAFISHYKPILNQKHINTNLKEISLVRNNLKELGYTNLAVEMNFEDGGIMGNITTPHVNKQKVQIEFKI